MITIGLFFEIRIKIKILPRSNFHSHENKENFYGGKHPTVTKVTWHATLTARDTRVVDVASSRHVCIPKKKMENVKKESTRDTFANIFLLSKIFVSFSVILNSAYSSFLSNWTIIAIYTILLISSLSQN